MVTEKAPELEALAICWPAISELDYAAAHRVMEYLGERMRMEIPRPSLADLLFQRAPGRAR